MKRQVEIFTANCPLCDPVVNMVKELACDQCEIIIYDLVKQCDDEACLTKLEEYRIKKIPAIAINGKMVDCCQDQGISKEDLIKAGIGQG